MPGTFAGALIRYPCKSSEMKEEKTNKKKFRLCKNYISYRFWTEEIELPIKAVICMNGKYIHQDGWSSENRVLKIPITQNPIFCIVLQISWNFGPTWKPFSSDLTPEIWIFHFKFDPRRWQDLKWLHLVAAPSIEF